MSSKARPKLPFFERYLRGDVEADAIDDFIDAWHEIPGACELFDYLGMTRDEYGLWLRDPESLPRIAQARRQHSRPAARR